MSVDDNALKLLGLLTNYNHNIFVKKIAPKILKMARSLFVIDKGEDMNAMKVCCLLLSMMFVASQVQAAGGTGATLSRISVSSISDVMPMLKQTSNKSFPLIRLGTLSLIAGTGTMIMGSMAGDMWFMGLGGVLNICAGGFYCAKKMASTKVNNLETELLGDDIVIYESSDNFELGLIVEESEIDYSAAGDRYYTVASTSGMHRTIESKQIKHILNITDYYSQIPGDQANLDELPLLKDTDAENMQHLVGAVIAFEQNGQNYIRTISEVQAYLGDGIKLVIGTSIIGRRDIIRVDNKGNALRYGEPLQGIILNESVENNE